MRFLIGGIKVGAIIVLAGLIVVGARAGFSYASESAAKPTGEVVTLDVSKGESVGDIGKELKARRLISDINLFRAYVYVNQKAKKFSEGTFTFTKGMTVSQIIDILAGSPPPPVNAPGEVSVRIPEGIRVEQLPGILRDAGLGTAAADIITAAKTGTWNYDFLKDRPPGSSLEGFLFPDTYRFATDADANTVIRAMLDNFQNKWQVALNSQAASQRGKSPEGVANLYQAVVIASIVEREAGSDADRADIASVYYNRLRHQPPMRLQADPTVQYAVGTEAAWWKKQLTQQDLDTQHSSNTYVIDGLPPTPICSPSLKSLQAALTPSTTDYLYFVAKNDGTGTHAFAKTNDEQNANIRKYQKGP